MDLVGSYWMWGVFVFGVFAIQFLGWRRHRHLGASLAVITIAVRRINSIVRKRS